MSGAASDLLWHMNNEYRKRLSKVERYIELLEPLVAARASVSDGDLMTILKSLRIVQQQLTILNEEHRGWRYTYFYDPNDNKRMVHDAEEVQRALVFFEQMRDAHEQRLRRIYEMLTRLPRPDPDLTYVPNGDLWDMLYEAFDSLAAFIVAPDSTISA